MNGMNATTGKSLSGLDHVRQSVTDILTTPIGSRVMRRNYGSRLFELIDSPLTGSTLVDIYAAAAEALGTWEPRLKVTRVQAKRIQNGFVEIDLEATYLPDGRAITMDGIIV